MGEYIVEVRLWVKQVRREARSGEYSMSKAEAERIREDLIQHGVDPEDIRISEV